VKETEGEDGFPIKDVGNDELQGRQISPNTLLKEETIKMMHNGSRCRL